MVDTVTDSYNFYLKVLLNKYADGRNLIRFLSQEKKDILESVDVDDDDFCAGVDSIKDFFKQVHYSWLLEKLKKASKSQRNIILAALPAEKIVPFKNIIEADFETVESLPDYLKSFFYKPAYAIIQNKIILPYKWIGKSALGKLLILNKLDLEMVIDFLGLHDLASEIPKILSKNILQRISLTLTVKQKKYLKECVANKEYFTTSEIGLNQWNGDVKTLKHSLHRRGMIRLAAAISKEDLFFKWYLYHKLDIGRAQFIKKNQINNISEENVAYLQNNILDIINLLMER